MLPNPRLKTHCLAARTMVEAWRSFEHDGASLSFRRKLALMTDRLWTWRQNQALARRLQVAKLRANTCVEDIDFRASRGLDATCAFAYQRQRLGPPPREPVHHRADRRGQELSRLRPRPQSLPRRLLGVLHPALRALFRDLAWRAPTAACAACWRAWHASMFWWSTTGHRRRSTAGTSRILEICEDRYPAALDPAHLPASRRRLALPIGEPTVADGILDRLVHNASRVELRGDSCAKTNPRAPTPVTKHDSLSRRRFQPWAGARGSNAASCPAPIPAQPVHHRRPAGALRQPLDLSLASVQNRFPACSAPTYRPVSGMLRNGCSTSHRTRSIDKNTHSGPPTTATEPAVSGLGHLPTLSAECLFPCAAVECDCKTAVPNPRKRGKHPLYPEWIQRRNNEARENQAMVAALADAPIAMQCHWAWSWWTLTARGPHQPGRTRGRHGSLPPHAGIPRPR